MPSTARKLAAREPGTDLDDPVLAAFARAPVDDRPETDEERAAVEAAKAGARASGQMVAHADVVAAIDRWRSAG